MNIPCSSTSPASDSPTAGDTAVEVRTAATAKHLSAIRAVAADLAMRQDYDLDSVADLRLAVDEACSTLVQLAVAGSELRCRFTPGLGTLRVLASVRSEAGTGPPTSSFSWQVLHTLTEEARSEVVENGAGYLVFIELVKRKPVQQ